MKKYLFLFISTLLFYSCNSTKTMNQNFKGHWINEDFYNYITEKKNLNEFNGEKIEFVIPDNDTNYTLINFNRDIKSGALELMDNNHLVIKNYFGHYKNADVMLVDNKIEFLNNETGEKIVFKKVTTEDLGSKEAVPFTTHCLPMINNYYISGKYQFNNDIVVFKSTGKILNLGKFVNYTFCMTSECRNSDKSNTLFLSDINNEGNFYEYLIKPDSLIIYEINEEASIRGLKGGNIGIKYALKKLN